MIPQPAENSSQNSVTTSYPLPVQMAGRVSSVCSAVTKSGSVVTVPGSHVTYFPTCSGTCASLAVARQFFCETRTEFLRKNSQVLRSKSETRSLASTAPKMEGAVHVKGRVLAWGGAAFAAPPLAFCPWGSSYPSVASPASSAAPWAATGSVYSDQP